MVDVEMGALAHVVVFVEQGCSRGILVVHLIMHSSLMIRIGLTRGTWGGLFNRGDLLLLVIGPIPIKCFLINKPTWGLAWKGLLNRAMIEMSNGIKLTCMPTRRR
ncbi:hypothetical protein Hanom_Chr15g01411831 [Helianthus anomalus]